MTETTSTRRRGRKLAGILAGGLALSLIPFAVPASAQTDPLPTPPRDIRLNACPVDDGDDNELGTADDTTEVPSAGFTDVAAGATHAFSIDCVVWYEVASGTSATTYTPGGNVKREQMATFIAQLIDYAAENGTGVALDPVPTGNLFPCDVSTASTHYDNIQRLADAGVVAGTGSTTAGACFDPGGDVTRNQMATFIKQAQDYITGVDLPLNPNDYFVDDDTDTHENNINIIAGEGIARGTGTDSNNDALYSPGTPVKRDQMASFLANKLDFLVEDAVTEPPPTVSEIEVLVDDTPDQGDDIDVEVTAVRGSIETIAVSGCGIEGTDLDEQVFAGTNAMETAVDLTIPEEQPTGGCDLTVVTEIAGTNIDRTITSTVEITVNAA